MVDCYTLIGSWPYTEMDLTLDALAAGMQARGVARSLVTHTTGIFYHSSEGNDLAVELARQHPALTPVSVINPLEYPRCLAEVDRRLEQGVQVFRLCPREHHYPFSAEVAPLREVLSRLQGARLILVDLHHQAAPVIGNGLAELFPVPTALTVGGRGLGTVLCAARNAPNVWLETSALEEGGALEAAVEHLGADRILFGSGSPLQVPGSAIMSVQYAEISEADRTAIFEGNAQRLLG